ncbi:uncharacterized protein LOC119068817 [Bradysia coprophila]|uniref:uncharacterized protein LOC119068817 n=1 Tax=Bradysia coprophila TaxID=38358 RepID=UPI00187DD5DF|nr:uncharacterized protein LOC119068817 [Bradysia coprophila]
MFGLKIASVLILCVVVVNADDAPSLGLRAVLRVYDECQKAEGGFPPCIKKKTISFIDRVTKIDAITIGDGVKLVRTEEDVADQATAAATQTDYEQSLPRGLEARDEALSLILFERISQFFNGRVLKINLPKLSSDDIGRQLEEGRGKMKKMMGMMMMGFAMKMAAMVPVAIAGLYILAGKALIISKIALLLAGIIGIKKLLSSKQSSGGSSGWSSGGSSGGGWQSSGGSGGHGGGGWDRRSIEAQSLAYNGYAPKSQ